MELVRLNVEDNMSMCELVPFTLLPLRRYNDSIALLGALASLDEDTNLGGCFILNKGYRPVEIGTVGIEQPPS